MYEKLATGSFNRWRKNKEISLFPLAWTFISAFLLVLLGFFAAVPPILGFVAADHLFDFEMGLIAAIILAAVSIVALCLAYIYAVSIFDASFYKLCDSVIKGKRLKLEDAVFKSKPLWKKFFFFKLATILIYLAAFAISMLPSILFVGLGAFMPDLMVLFIVIGLFISLPFLVLAFIFLGFFFFFSGPIVYYEKGNTLKMVSLCKKLLFKKPLHVLLSFLVIWIVSILVSMILGVVTLPLYVLGMFVPVVGNIPGIISSIVTAAFVTPWATLFLLSAYKK